MNLPIRLNMGETSPEGQLIGIRELYIYKNGNDYELWIGNDTTGKSVPLTVVNAEKSSAIDVGTNMLRVDNTALEAIIAGLNVKINAINQGGITTNEVEITPHDSGEAILNNMKLNNTKQIIVEESMYGDKLPTEGVAGQIFFKI